MGRFRGSCVPDPQRRAKFKQVQMMKKGTVEKREMKREWEKEKNKKRGWDSVGLPSPATTVLVPPLSLDGSLRLGYACRNRQPDHSSPTLLFFFQKLLLK